MNIKPIAASAALLLAFASPSFATPVTLTFEGANSYGFLDNFYNGGTDIPANSATATPAAGPNYHIAWGTGAMPTDEIPDAPSGTMVMTPVGGDASMFATGGLSFSDTLSFSYFATDAFTINVRDAASAVIATFTLAATDAWTEASFSFAGFAKSIDFTGGTYVAAFDNIAVNEVPIPAAGWLFASGLAALGRMRRKRAA